MKKRTLFDSMKLNLPWIALISVLAMTACGRNDDDAGPPHHMIPSVAVTEVTRTNAEILRDYPGRVHGSRKVQVRAMVQGILKEKLYQEGSAVDQNHVLFLIDPEPYEIALRRARAELANAAAGHDSALRERERYERLHEQKAVSTQERDNAQTQYELAHARLELAKAAVADAERNLRYTRVQAPVSGMTDMEAVSEGNLIEWGRLLTTITQIDPVHVHFSLPERDALTHRLSLARRSGDRRFHEVSLIVPDGTEFDRRGEIDFMASTIDPATGTVTARAVFSNPHAILVPGQFVRIRMYLEELNDIIIVPETAISQGEKGARIFVVDDKDTARERSIRIGPVVAEGQVIFEGIDEGDRIVVEGHVALRDGVSVSVRDAGTVSESGTFGSGEGGR